MAEQWHLVRGGHQSGPHSFEEVQGLLAGVDVDQDQVLVWTERLKEWVDPRKVPGLLGTPPAPAPAEMPANSAMPASPVRAAAARPADLSSLNPYETPASTLARPSAPVSTGELGNHELQVGACIQTGWKLTTSRFGKIVLFGLAYLGIMIVIFIPLGALQAAFGLNENETSPTLAAGLITFGIQLLQNVISIFLGIGGMMFGLGMVRRTNPSVGILFAGGPHFLPVFGASILYGLSVVAGLMLLIIPGIFLAVRLSQFQFAIIDQKLGPLDGIKASWAMTRGNFWNMILLGLAGMGICLLGVLALGIGMLWAYPTVLLAGVAAYLCMSRGVGTLPRLD